MDFKNKKILVAGVGKSGTSSAKALLGLGANVTIYDAKKPKNFEELDFEFQKAKKLDASVEYGFETDPISLIAQKDYVVLSPGISIEQPFAAQAQKNATKVIGEIELGFLLCKAPIIAITGTNGKTTTTALTGAIFSAHTKHTRRKTFVLGNIGIPIVSCALETSPQDFVVAEVAGFQLESIVDFHTVACAFLNISQDHLDRFGTMEKYIDSKTRMFENQTEKDCAVLNLDDPIVKNLCEKTKARKLFFSTNQKNAAVFENDTNKLSGAYIKDNKVFFKKENCLSEYIIDTKDIFIPGEHNLQNALASICLAKSQNVETKTIEQVLKIFTGVEHRLEFVCEKNGVRYINDSKATNPDSTIQAVKAMNTPTILILGGSNKNSDYVPVFKAFKNITKVVAIGETKEQILRDAKKANFLNIELCNEDFEKCVLYASSLAKSGENVLLSPACASYDMFENFEKRGEKFKAIVKNK